MALFSGFTRVSTVPLGSLPKAALVGAKTVNGPGPFNVSTSPAALTAATRVVWSFEWTAFSTMVLLGYIAAPPTMTVLSARTGPAAMAARAKHAAKVLETSRTTRISGSPTGFRRRMTGTGSPYETRATKVSGRPENSTYQGKVPSSGSP